MEKDAVGRQMGGFMQTRARTRPYRVDTLLSKDLHSKLPSDVLEDPVHDAERKYEQSMAADEGGGEFVQKEGAEVDIYQAPAALLNMDPGALRAAAETRPTLKALSRVAEKAPKGVGRIRAYLAKKRGE